MSIPENAGEQAGFEGQPADSESWILRTMANGYSGIILPETGTIWAAWETHSPSFEADVSIRDRSGRETMVVAPPSNYPVTAGDELTWKVRSPGLSFRLGWGYLRSGPAAS